MPADQFELKSPPSDAISAVRFAPGSSTKLLVSSWDRHVYLYDTHAEPDGQLIRSFEHRAPVLDVCFGEENEAFTASLDWDVRRYLKSRPVVQVIVTHDKGATDASHSRIDLSTGDQTILSSHEAAACRIAYHQPTKTLLSASWDSTLHIHHPHAPTSIPCTLSLPAKPFALSLSTSKLVIAMSSRLVHIYDISALSLFSSQAAQPPPNPISGEPFQRRESSLKFMSRAIACMPNDAGYASSSIEGRVAVEWFDASEESQARKYAFKCHRQAVTEGEDKGMDVVYPVHALAFHPTHGTFASGGGDGVVALWDAVAKRRIRQYQKFPASVAAMDFSGDGKLLAVGISPGFEDGSEDVVGEGTVRVFVRTLAEGEAKGKAGK